MEITFRTRDLVTRPQCSKKKGPSFSLLYNTSTLLLLLDLLRLLVCAMHPLNSMEEETDEEDGDL